MGCVAYGLAWSVACVLVLVCPCSSVLSLGGSRFVLDVVFFVDTMLSLVCCTVFSVGVVALLPVWYSLCVVGLCMLCCICFLVIALFKISKVLLKSNSEGSACLSLYFILQVGQVNWSIPHLSCLYWTCLCCVERIIPIVLSVVNAILR